MIACILFAWSPFYKCYMHVAWPTHNSAWLSILKQRKMDRKTEGLNGESLNSPNSQVFAVANMSTIGLCLQNRGCQLNVFFSLKSYQCLCDGNDVAKPTTAAQHTLISS